MRLKSFRPEIDKKIGSPGENAKNKNKKSPINDFKTKMINCVFNAHAHVAVELSVLAIISFVHTHDHAFTIRLATIQKILLKNAI
jgi:hypothetical protein